MSDDDSFVMNIANDGAGTSGEQGNPREDGGANVEKGIEAAAGGRAARAGRARAMGGQREETRAGGLERARGRWWDVVERGWTSGRGWRAREKLSSAARTKTRANDASRSGRGTGSRAEDDDDGFEVIRGEGANAENGEDGLEFNPRDWASLMKRGGGGSGRDSGEGRAVMTVGRVRTRARVIARECSGEADDVRGVRTSGVHGEALDGEHRFRRADGGAGENHSSNVGGRDVLVRAEDRVGRR